MENSGLGLKLFKITRLFGKNSVELKFKNGIGIFVGENGIGKTTILNVLYFALTKKYHKLMNVDFETIELIFENGIELRLHKEWLLNDYQQFYSDEVKNNISKFVSKNDYQLLLNHIYNNKNMDEIYKSNVLKRRVPYSVIKEMEYAIKNKLEFVNNNILEFSNLIDKYITDEVLYFPTYRRIEEDLIKLGIDLAEKDVDNKEEIELIQFGMTDVEKVFKNIEEEIKKSTLLGYSQVTGGMISHLVHLQDVTDIMKDKIKDYETLDIVLDRVGNHLRDNDRKRIRELIKTNELFDENKSTYNPLIFFLFNLFEIYEKHRQKDDAIKSFTKVCNSYLTRKEIKYNESTVQITIVDKKTQDPIELSTLSSGEKQIVSLFTRIFLTTQNNFILLFDEPELSLSIEWQEKLLEDVVQSNKCSFMIAVTHSPFIYDNSLRNYAQSIELCIHEV